MAATGVTRLLEDWQAGDHGALEELTPLVYDELRRLAARYMRQERPGHTLQATGLVNEALIRMAGMDVRFADRAHFCAVAARAMRRILVDYAKARRSEKRGGGSPPLTLREAEVAAAAPDLLVLDEALERLAALDPRKCDILVLHYFGGMTYEETAAALAVSPATVHRDLRLARAWLINELQDG